jgi:putative acetyltransferase
MSASSHELAPFYRKATIDDAPGMFELRKSSILELAPAGMSIRQSVDWASRLTLEVMTQRFNVAEFWVAEMNASTAGWVGIRGDEIYGLYVNPNWINHGIGSGLLRLAEEIMLAAGITMVRLDASWNAEAFYLRRGYRPTGPWRPNDTRIFKKTLRPRHD